MIRHNAEWRNNSLEMGFIRKGLLLRQVDAGECKSLARARKRACWFESSFCNNDLTIIYESTEEAF